MGLTFLLAKTDGLAEIFFRVGVFFSQPLVPLTHFDSQFVEAGANKLLAVIFSTQFTNRAEGGT